MSQEFPKWKYHRSQEPCVVKDPDEEAALGPGWADSPAAFSEAEQAPTHNDHDQPLVEDPTQTPGALRNRKRRA